MLTERLSTATRCLWRSVSEGARNILTLRERYRAIMDARKTRGITLLREWLSPMQRAQFDASKSFDVVGCDSGRRYRIHYGRVTNVHEIDDAGQPVIPSAGCGLRGKPCKPAALSLFSGGFPAASGLSKSLEAPRGSASDASARPRFLAIRAAPETSDGTGGAE